MQLFVDRQVERTNRNVLWTGVLVLALLGGLAVATRGYFDNYLRGPFPATLPEVAQAGREAPARSFVRLEGELLETGREEITVKKDKYSNRETSRRVSAVYLALHDGERTLIVKAPVGTGGAAVSGWLRKPEGVDREVIAAVIRDEPEIAPTMLPLVLDATTSRANGAFGLAAGAVLLLLALAQLQRWSARRARPATHPIWKRLAQLGEARSLAAQIDMETRANDLQKFPGRATLTRSWLLRERVYGFDLVPVDRLVWIHKKVTAQKQYFVTVGKTYEAVVCDRDGGQLSFRGKVAAVDRLLASLAERVPWVLAGWTEELERAWVMQRSQVIAAVDARREELRRGASSSAQG